MKRWVTGWEKIFANHISNEVLISRTHSSVQFSCSVMSNCLRPHKLQHAQPPCPSPTPGVHPNSCPLSWWCHPTILSSVIPFSPCPQSFQASGFFQMSQVFTSGGQSIGVSASTSVLPMNTQDWSPLGWPWKKNRVLRFAATWIDLEGIILHGINQTKTNTLWYVLYVESKKYNKLVNYNKTRNRLTDTENKLVVSSGEKEWGDYEVRGLRGINYYVWYRLQGYSV